MWSCTDHNPSTLGKMSRSSHQIESFEREARKKYNTALLHLRSERTASWFQSSLKRKILPQLSRIGFDNQLSQALFQIALPSWQLMGPAIDDCLWIHPRLTRDIEKIRKSILITAAKKRKTLKTLANMSSQEIYNHTRRSLAPENLSSILDDIHTSWIILPRAHSLLREKDGCCLISYLKYLRKEKCPDFKRLLARIIIEFLANYSLKYAGAQQSQRAVTEVVFYGYSVMFWKNLAHPPDKCEELSIYKNFLGWAQVFLKRTNAMTSDMTATMKKMMTMEKTLFPTEYAYSFIDDKEMDSDRFLITLRHGKRGVEATCNSFGVTGNVLKKPSLNRPIIPSGPKAFSRLISEIEKRYTHETQTTKEAIHLFIQQVKDAYTSSIYQLSRSPAESQKQFTGLRLVRMINDFKQSLQQQKP